MAKAEGKEFSFLGETHIRTDFLEVFNFDSPEQKINIEYPEFSAVCPFSGLPDIALLIIKYYPTGGKCIELKSLKYYLVSYRNVGIYQEAVTKRISEDLSAVLDTQVEVSTVYNTRGGFNTTCIENELDNPSDMIRDLCV